MIKEESEDLRNAGSQSLRNLRARPRAPRPQRNGERGVRVAHLPGRARELLAAQDGIIVIDDRPAASTPCRWMSRVRTRRT